MNSIEVPKSRPRSLTRSTIPASTVTSSAVVGSSRIRSAGSRHQRHGDDDALLLAAGELVRDSCRGCAPGSGRRTASTARSACARAVRRAGAGVDHRHFHQLAADLHRRVQARHRLLVDHGDLRAADLAQLGVRHGDELAALEAHAAADDPAVLAEVAHHPERHGGLAAAELAHEPERLARPRPWPRSSSPPGSRRRG